MYARLKMQCTDCSHVQEVRGSIGIVNGELHYWWGSGYNWCDNCDGVPRPIATPELFNDDDTPSSVKTFEFTGE